jgi:long-chain acyl-CoA synthetase
MTTTALPPTLSASLSQTAAAHPARPALRLGELTLSYGELDALVTALAANLVKHGVQPGDRIALLFPNCPQFVIAYYAITRAGAIANPLNCLLGPGEVATILRDSGARLLLAHEALAPLAHAAQGHLPTLEQVIISGSPAASSDPTFEDWLRPPAEPVTLPAGRPQDVAVLVYTSGTTGVPKGAMLTHQNLLANALACRDTILVGPEDCFATVLPLFHSFGATVCMILPILLGACSLHIPRFQAAALLDTLRTSGATVFPAVPSMLALLLKVKDRSEDRLPALRLAVSGGAPLPLAVLQGFEDRFGVPLLEGYGPTEASPVVSVNPLVGTRKPGSVGPPLPGVEVAIRAEDGRWLATGEVGEICVRGPNVMAGYWQHLEATAEVIHDGWLLTGDMGKLDEEGYLYILGRQKDMIIVGGMNVYPREIEDVALTHPAVAEAAAVGVSHTLKGEVPRLFVVLREGAAATEQTLLDHCRAHLAAFKCPEAVHFIAELPRTATGKVMKNALLSP